MTGRHFCGIIKMYYYTVFSAEKGTGFPENNMPSVKISASVLNSNLAELGKEAAKIAENGVEYVHYDVMDGEFVENITYGSSIQKAILPYTTAKMDTHLMVMHPRRQIKLFADAGSEIITFHVESDCEPDSLIDEIHALGVRAGVAVKPNTPAEAVFPYIEKADMILVMTVEPGYGGQGFIPEMTDKIRLIRAEATRLGKDIDIQVDGGINTETAKLVREAGANVLVAGTFLFRAENMRAAADSMR